MSAERYLHTAAATIEKIADAQLGQIHTAAELLVKTIRNGGSLFSFGASHSFMITEEMVYRTGGLMLVNPIYPHGMNASVTPQPLTSKLERVVGIGRELLAASRARAGDVLIITSTSGRNAVTIDMALQARETKITTIAITALAYTGEVASRHPSGKKLAEVCDLVIDNCVPYGDAAVEIPGFKQKVGPLSTVAGCAIANAIVAEVVHRLVEQGVTPPVFISANVEGGEAHNARLLSENRQRIYYM